MDYVLTAALFFLVGSLITCFLWLGVEKRREKSVYDGYIIVDYSDPDSPPDIYLQFSSTDKLMDGIILECKVIEKTSRKKHPL